MANAADCDAPSLAAGPTLQAQDVVAGLGAAPRDLLATSLALFEDSTLLRRLRQLAAEYKGKWFDKTPASDREQQVAESLQTQIEGWKSSPVTDDVLRVVLWMRMREALGLRALTFGSLRSARTAADDLVAATLARKFGTRIHVVEPYASELPIEFTDTGASLIDIDTALEDCDILAIRE